jgi:alpha-mannosidase
VAGGQFAPVGGMWVESDTNMPGGEALARQFIAGQSFFSAEFGVHCEEAWLPDSFGYSAALPQIVSLAGQRWFLTQKMSWNQVNRMPHHTFWWEGIDGTRVFTHLPPADTYISELSGAELAHAERNFSEQGRASISLVPFGWGDGGGGPTREMLAAAHRTADLEGSPRVELGTSRQFFTAAEAEYPDAPVWSGEMYLELHRGVFTSQLRTKQGNRRNEALLRQAELWCATATIRTGAAYPAAALQEAWHTVLLLQFHDILPGSAIAWVHREAERRHADVTDALEGLIAQALEALAPAVAAGGVLVNASPFARRGVPALSAAAPSEAPAPATITGDRLDGLVMDNGVLRVEFDGASRIRSLRAHADGREAIPPGHGAAALRVHRDLPNLWDAWDLDEHYRRTVTELDDPPTMTAVIDDDGAAEVTTTRAFGSSNIRMRFVLRPGAESIQLDLLIDWHERERILKLSMPIDVHADRIAAETQFGHVFRATHTNTSWDAARFEACQHRFVHVGEPGFGVAIANDSTYGYDVDRVTRDDGGTTTTVRFSLLRAPRFPDPESDQGEHRMRFAIRPASGIADAVALGYDLATPMSSMSSGPIAPLVTSTAPAVVIDTVKLAEDGSGDLVVRCYESLGGRARTVITVDGVAEAITIVDLLERDVQGQPAASGSAIEIAMRPFQITTLRFRGVRAR